MTDIPQSLQASYFDINSDGKIEFWEVRQKLGQLIADHDLDRNKLLEGREVLSLHTSGFSLFGGRLGGKLAWETNEESGNGEPLADLTLARNFWKFAGGEFAFDDRKSTQSPGDKPSGSISYADWFKDFGKAAGNTYRSND